MSNLIEERESEFEIEDIALEPNRDTVQSRYPFEKLEVGQSFFVPGKNSKQMSAARSHWKKKFPDRAWVCKADEKIVNGEKVSGCRVGRTK